MQSRPEGGDAAGTQQMVPLPHGAVQAVGEVEVQFGPGQTPVDIHCWASAICGENKFNPAAKPKTKMVRNNVLDACFILG